MKNEAQRGTDAALWNTRRRGISHINGGDKKKMRTRIHGFEFSSLRRTRFACSVPLEGNIGHHDRASLRRTADRQNPPLGCLNGVNGGKPQVKDLVDGTKKNAIPGNSREMPEKSHSLSASRRASVASPGASRRAFSSHPKLPKGAGRSRYLCRLQQPGDAPD